MHNTPCNIGVIGTGSIGEKHLRTLATIPTANLAAVYDTDTERAAQLAQELNTYSAKNLEDFMSKIDAATVATPTITHREIGEQLLHANKHVLIEKPIANTSQDAQALVALAKEKKCILQVGHIERFNPVLDALEEHLTQPKFIEVHRLSPFPNRSMDIGVVLDLMIHDLEIILHLVKSPVEDIDATGVYVLTNSEDIANARIRFANGCVANLTASRISPERMRKIRVFQSDTYLSLDYQNQEGKIFRKHNGQILQEPVAVEKDLPLTRELASFIQCAQEGNTPRVTGRSATSALELAIEITQQIASAS